VLGDGPIQLPIGFPDAKTGQPVCLPIKKTPLPSLHAISPGKRPGRLDNSVFADNLFYPVQPDRFCACRHRRRPQWGAGL